MVSLPTIHNRTLITVIQKVLESSVSVGGKEISRINTGLNVLVGIEGTDAQDDIDWLSNKIVNMRLFVDDQGVMNKSLREVNGDILLISQFTLHASTKKGNRPSYIKAARPDIAIPIYELFIQALEEKLGKPIKTGQFGSDMKVSITNDGPVTLIVDSKDKK